VNKLLIVDDEPLVCVGIQSMLKWEDLGIEIAGTARNGQQALELIENIRPDIVITDIKMPLKSGLEVAEECAQKYGKLPLFIILTSFEEFEFVRRALGLQAVDYLIKLELTPESLTASVTKALSMLEDIHKADAPPSIPPALPARQENIQGLREKFFLRLCNNLFETKEQYLAQKEELGLDFSYSAMMAVSGEIEAPLNNYTDHEKLRALYTSCIQMVREMLEKSFTCYTVVPDARHFTLVFCLEGTSRTVPADGEEVKGRLSPPDREWRKRLEDGLKKTIGIVHNYFNVHIRMAAGIPVEDPLMLEISYLSARRAFEETSRECPLRFSETPDYKQQVIARVEDYIRRNLEKHLSLHEVAEVFNFSPNYLSQLFSKYAGEGFVDYISAMRINAAKEMLARGEGPIYTIAEKLGFESAFYFSKVFKRVEGISPRDFLHKLELQNEKQGEGN
jgi:two-component system response regulator YesN